MKNNNSPIAQYLTNKYQESVCRAIDLIDEHEVGTPLNVINNELAQCMSYMPIFKRQFNAGALSKKDAHKNIALYMLALSDAKDKGIRLSKPLQATFDKLKRTEI